MCRFFLGGSCSKANCYFNHNTQDYPCRFFHLDKYCKMGNECRFSHAPIPESDVEDFLSDNKTILI